MEIVMVNCDHDARIVQFLWLVDDARIERPAPESGPMADPKVKLNARFMATCLCGGRQGHVSEWEGLAAAMSASNGGFDKESSAHTPRP